MSNTERQKAEGRGMKNKDRGVNHLLTSHLLTRKCFSQIASLASETRKFPENGNSNELTHTSGVWGGRNAPSGGSGGQSPPENLGLNKSVENQAKHSNLKSIHLKAPNLPISPLPSILLLALGVLSPTVASAQGTAFQITVNSNADIVQPDEGITLREAIALANGTLSYENLSAAEQQLVGGRKAVGTTIEFNLQPQQTTIELNSALPAIAVSDVAIDGTTQPGYNQAGLEPGQTDIPMPIVTLTPAPGKTIGQGLLIVGNNIVIRGLSLYGFWAPRTPENVETPPADLLISHPIPPEDSEARPPENNWENPPQNITIEYNWLGTSPSLPSAGENTLSQYPTPETRSAFGAYIFNGDRIQLFRNVIANHRSSGIITSVRASNLEIRENILEGNGFVGMPDAIRLEGNVSNATVADNLIRNNAGSGVYVFKPEGSVAISDNAIADNGKRYKQAAIYLTGRGHQVTGNRIANQPGPGVVVATHPQGDRVQIANNQFTNLNGLDIDLVAQSRTGIYDYKIGDGQNPYLEIHHRRRQAANYGINAPRFVSREFFRTPAGQVTLLGEAEPGSQLEIYQVTPSTDGSGTSSIPIATTAVDENGDFSVTLTELRAGDRLSATVTHPDYGTSEPARPIEIKPLPGGE